MLIVISHISVVFISFMCYHHAIQNVVVGYAANGTVVFCSICFIKNTNNLITRRLPWYFVRFVSSRIRTTSQLDGCHGILFELFHHEYEQPHNQTVAMVFCSNCFIMNTNNLTTRRLPWYFVRFVSSIIRTTSQLDCYHGILFDLFNQAYEKPHNQTVAMVLCSICFIKNTNNLIVGQ